MKTILIYLSMGVLLFSPLFSGCASKDDDSEKSAIEEFTEKTGRSASESIQRPIDKARALQEKSLGKVGEADSLLDEE